MNLRIVVITLLACAILTPATPVKAVVFVYNNRQIEVNNVDSLVKSFDTTTTLNDSLLTDSIFLDSGKGIKYSKDTLDAKVLYQAEDSVIFNNREQSVYMYGKAKVSYEDITLESEIIKLDWTRNLITARGVEDSMGNYIGTPVFKEKGDSYKARIITYNYQSKKGKIFKLITQEGEGFIHGKEVKKEANDDLFIKTADYTTCDLEDPHFSIHSSKLKVVPDKVVVTGPAYLVVEDVPTPFILPFGIFPISKGRKSGIIFPEYGESREKGYFLRNGGYYFAVSDYMDISLKGDIFSRGSWVTKGYTNYKRRYRYNGNLNLNYGVTKLGNPLLKNNTKQTDFFIKWNHNQDPKAKPNSQMGANVYAGTSTYHRYNSYNYNDILDNTYRSNIYYKKTIGGTPFRFSANFEHHQSTKTKLVQLTLPKLTLYMNEIHPFQSESHVGKSKWYQKIGIRYSMVAKNQVSVMDSLLFEESTLQKIRNGVSHTVGVKSSMKVLKHLNLTPSFNYYEKWYLQTYRKHWNNDSARIEIDTVYDFQAARSYNTALALSTQIFGMLNMKKGKIKGIRHVITPSLTARYNPDFSNDFWGYWKKVQTDTTGKNFTKYSIFENTIYGGPSAGKVAGVGMSIDNNLEMKLFSRKDTLTNSRKIKIIESFNISSFYNFVADSLNLSKISMSGRTTLFNKITLDGRAEYDPYIMDTLYRRYNKFEYNENGRIARLSQRSLSISTLGLRFNNKKSVKQNSDNGTDEEMAMINENPDDYVDFKIPWSLSVGYRLTITDLKDYYKKMNGVLKQKDSLSIQQSLTLSMELNITPKWKISLSTGYNFDNNEITYTTINIYRDLHCWDMKFRWIPLGNLQSYSIDIQVKSSILQDLKLSKKRDWYDYQ